MTFYAKRDSMQTYLSGFLIAELLQVGGRGAEHTTYTFYIHFSTRCEVSHEFATFHVK